MRAFGDLSRDTAIDERQRMVQNLQRRLSQYFGAGEVGRNTSSPSVELTIMMSNLQRFEGVGRCFHPTGSSGYVRSCSHTWQTPAKLLITCIAAVVGKKHIVVVAQANRENRRPRRS